MNLRLTLLAAAGACALARASTALAANPLAEGDFYKDPEFAGSSVPGMDQPVAKWIGNWTPDVISQVSVYVDGAAAAGKIPVLVAYDIPGRDCGGYSQGGEMNYLDWIRGFGWGLAGRKAVVILEPDALALADGCPGVEPQERFDLLRQAVGILKEDALAAVYIDAGHPDWVPASTMAARLRSAGVDLADGFSLNVSNFYANDENIRYGAAISDLLHGKHFVIDTSRNGSGAVAGGSWCNPPEAALGAAPTSATGHPLVDAYLWIKRPGESDGPCNGGPEAGQWWPDYAQGLLRKGRQQSPSQESPSNDP